MAPAASRVPPRCMCHMRGERSDLVVSTKPIPASWHHNGPWAQVLETPGSRGDLSILDLLVLPRRKLSIDASSHG